MIFLKVVLLLIYLILLVAVYRVVDYIAWSDPDGVARLVDPFELSLKQLRWLLQARGINYYNAIEKSDLSDLVSKSGALTKGEIKAAEDLDTYSSLDTKTFTESGDLHDSIERSEDVWLVQIVSEDNIPVITAPEWRKLTKRAHSVGINTGQVFCKNKPNICESRSFWTSQLLMSYHYVSNRNGIHQKHYMTRHTDATSAFNWISRTLQGVMEEIPDAEQFSQHWLSTKARKSKPVQLVYVSSGNHLPVVFVTLKMKFKHDFRFGKLQRSKIPLNLELDKKADQNLPDAFICVITNRRIHIYGGGRVKGEYMHYVSLHLFLLSINPDINVVFMWSMYVCNLFAALSIFTVSWNFFACVVAVVKSFVAYNAVLLISWLLISSCKSTSLKYLTYTVLEYVQFLATTEYGGLVRYYLLHMMHVPFLIVLGYVVLFYTVFAVLKALDLINLDPVDDTDLSDILLANDGRSFGDNDISRRWIERLATPGLWLRPLVPVDYIDNLPVWEYDGVCVTSSDEDSDAGCCKAGARTSSPSPTRAWSTNYPDASRGRTCIPRSTTSRLSQGIVWSIRSCFRGRSPRFRRTAGPPKGMRQDQSCSVCLDNYKRHTAVCGLPCGHVFHHECILSWLYGDHHCCPICRWPAYQLMSYRNRS